MKKLFIIATVATLATTVQAAPKAAPASSKLSAQQQKAAPSKPVSAKPGSTSPGDGNASSTGTTSPGPGSPASGSSTLTTQQAVKKPSKTFSATLLSEMGVPAADANNPEMADKNFASLNYLALGYKISEIDKIALRQYFTANHVVAKDKPSKDEFVMGDTVATWSHKAGKILASEQISPLFYYYAPTSEASQAIKSAGTLRMDMNIEYLFTPKWSVSYFLSPRQSIVPDSTTIADGKPKNNFAKTSYIHYGALTHNFSDDVSAYGYAGFIHRWQTSSFSLDEEAPIGGIGASFSTFGGVLVLNPELYFEMPTVKNGLNTAAGGPAISEEYLTYQLVASVTF